MLMLMQKKTHFQNKGFAISLVLKGTVFGTRKCLLLNLPPITVPECNATHLGPSLKTQPESGQQVLYISSREPPWSLKLPSQNNDSETPLKSSPKALSMLPSSLVFLY